MEKINNIMLVFKNLFGILLSPKKYMKDEITVATPQTNAASNKTKANNISNSFVVGPKGIEPLSFALQTSTLTTFVKDPILREFVATPYSFCPCNWSDWST